MHKGYIIDYLSLSNGFIMTLFRIFHFAIKKENEGYGSYIVFQIGICRFEVNISFVWRTRYEKSIQEAKT